MDDPSHVDRDLDHLYPPFRDRLIRALRQANLETTGKFLAFRLWKPFETYRPRTRQEWLYAQGRTRPGGVVTYQRTGGKHGKGLACDVVWSDESARPRWDGPAALWAILGHAARSQGLVWGGDWRMRDLPHIEPSRGLLVLWAVPARIWLLRQPWR